MKHASRSEAIMRRVTYDLYDPLMEWVTIIRQDRNLLRMRPGVHSAILPPAGCMCPRAKPTDCVHDMHRAQRTKQFTALSTSCVVIKLHHTNPITY